MESKKPGATAELCCQFKKSVPSGTQRPRCISLVSQASLISSLGCAEGASLIFPIKENPWHFPLRGTSRGCCRGAYVAESGRYRQYGGIDPPSAPVPCKSGKLVSASSSQRFALCVALRVAARVARDSQQWRKHTHEGNAMQEKTVNWYIGPFVVVVVGKPRALMAPREGDFFYPPLEGEGRAPKGRGVG